jgi:hypothetical protein
MGSSGLLRGRAERCRADPGGGVICVNNVGDSAANPCANSTQRIQSRNIIPNAIVPSDITRFTRLTMSRLR